MYTGPNIITDGLVLALDAANPRSYPGTGTSWNDLSGNGNNGTLVNGPTFNSDNNGSIVFDGVDDYINISNIPSDFNSASGIFKTTSTSLEMILLAGFFNSSSQTCLGIQSTGSDGYLVITRGSGKRRYTSKVINDGKWHHFHVNREELDDFQLYVDGELSTFDTNVSNDRLSSRFLIAARYLSAYTLNLQGSISSILSYNRILQNNEILQNYYQAPIVTDGLVLAVDAGNLVSYESGSTTTYSLTGSLSGSLVNDVEYSSGNGGGWVFDSTDDYIDLPNSLGYSTTTLSVFTWYKSNGQPTGDYHIICGGQECEISIPWPSGALRTGIFTDVRYVSNHGSGLNDGKWHYVGFTFNGSTKTSYIDGINVGTQSITTGTLITSFTNRRLGRYGSSGTYYANGNMGGYWVYNKTLSPEEISQNFNAQRSRFGI